LWFIAPGNFNWFYCALPFIIAGAANVASLNATIHYFLQNVDRQRRVAVSMFVSITTGAGAGLAGTLLASILLKIAELNANAAVPLSRYRMFFLCAFVLLIPCLYLVSRLKPLPPDKRKLPR
jgi:MFS family permease